MKYLLPLTLLTLLVVPIFQTPLHAETLDQFLAKAKQAAGGDGWDKIRNIYLKGKAKIGGLEPDREEWIDLLKVRFAQKFQLGFISGGQGFDGKIAWGKQPNKPAEMAEQGDFYEVARTNACRKSFVYLYPKRCDAQLEYLGPKQDAGQQFQVVLISPKGGKPTELWFDNTYLLARTRFVGSENFGYFSDYRTVNGLKYPFLFKGGGQESQIAEVQFNIPITNEQYQPPVSTVKNNRKS